MSRHRHRSRRPSPLLGLVAGVATASLVGAGWVATRAATAQPLAPPAAVLTAAPISPVTQVLGADSVGAFGDAPFVGSAGSPPASPIAAVVPTRTGFGYWTAWADGTVGVSGDAAALGAVQGPAAPIVGMAVTPSGHGYWLVGADGGVFSFGDARFLGSTGGIRLSRPIVGMAATRTGAGYWLVGADGGVFSFGDAPFLGSAAGRSASPVVGIAATADGDGYWLATGRITRTHLGSFVATCYTGGGTTASGAPTSLAVVAVDPSVIPLGTKVWIAGIGARTALDTGGAIRGQRLDIWEPSYQQCVQFGAQAVDVFLDR
jgi:3D (Asp-Asp-Asp) domain-containing protein